MEILCTRPSCSRAQNVFSELDNLSQLKTVQQRYCKNCGMPLILAGRYIPLKLLGKGGFGAAFLAIDRYTPTIRYCVVKQFQPSGNLDSEDLSTAEKLFEREAIALESLGKEHRQIPDLFAFFPLVISSADNKTQEQYFYIVQEFIDGKTLEQELAENGKFSEEKIMIVLVEMLKILEFVHAQQIIHRDIKPSNIMRNKEGILYLLDFGAVRQIATGSGTNIQGKSTGIYSLGFAPPEQMAGSQVYPCTDLYALAATCVNLVTGQTPQELFDVYNNELNWKPEAKHLSDRLINVLDMMLKNAPRARFQSATEVLNALTYPTTINPPSKPENNATVIKPRPSNKTITKTANFSSIELISCAAFTGFEAGLLLVVLRRHLSVPLSLGITLGLVALLVFLQNRRIIEKLDLLIFALVTLLAVWFIPALAPLNSKDFGLIFALVTAIASVFITAIGRLFYVFLSRK